MKVFLCFERFNIEFLSKLYLSSFLLKKKNINKVYIGNTKIILKKILNEAVSHKKNDMAILYKDIWKSVEIIIILLKKLGINFFSSHEEEHLLLQNNYKKSLNEMYVSSKIQNYIDTFFTMSKFTKNYFLNVLNYNQSKILIAGNSRYQYMNYLKKNFSQKNNKILCCLNFELFSYSRFKKYSINKKKLSLIKKNILFTGITDEDKYLNYRLNRDLLRDFKLLAKNTKKNFILRPYPGEEKYLKFYKMYFKNVENIEFHTTNTIFNSFLESSKVITTPDNVALESSIFGLQTLIFYDNKNLIHRYMFKNHPLISKKNFLKFKSFKEIQNIINANKQFDTQSFVKHKLGLNYSTNEIISNTISKKKFTDKNIKKNYLLKFFLTKILKKINNDYNKKNYGKLYYDKFVRNNKFSISRIFFFFLTRKSNLRLDSLYLIYKFILGRNYDKHSIFEHSPYKIQNKSKMINNLFPKFLKKFNPKIKISYLESGTIICLSKMK